MTDLEYVSKLFIEVYYNILGILSVDILPDLFNYNGVVINSRLTSALARCIQRRANNSTILYRFDVSPDFFRLDQDIQINVIAHEWIHAMCDLGEHHGKRFKYYMNLLNGHGFNIRISGTDEDFGLPKREKVSKYILRCKKCGVLINKTKMCDTVRNPSDYLHKGCGGTMERIK